MERLGNQVVWEPIFKRNLTDQEEKQFVTLIDLLNFIFIPRKGEDSSFAASEDWAFFCSLFFLGHCFMPFG